jgi:hypothetical protein
VRTAGRLVVVTAKAVYLLAAVCVLGALCIGVLTLTIGGVIARAVVGADAPAREGVATAAALACVLLPAAFIGIRAARRDPGRLRGSLVSTGRRASARVGAFAAEWSSAGERRIRRRRLDDRKRTPRRRGRRRSLPVERAVEPLLGSRLWLVGPDHCDGGGAVLIAPVAGTRWRARRLDAVCERALRPDLEAAAPPHESAPPDLECVCGIYAFKGASRPAPRHRAPLVSGRVALSGRVVEGPRGYRAARAEIVGPLRVTLRCAGSVEGELWTRRPERGWESVEPGPCLFEAATLAVGEDEYVGLCAMHAGLAAPLLEGVAQVDPMALQAQLELRYGVEVKINERGRGWT